MSILNLSLRDLTIKSLLIIFGFLLLIQKDIAAQPFFTISAEPTPSLFKQEEPKLFNGRDGEFVVVWRDFRDGREGYYGQLFDQQGTRRGDNSKLFSNEAFAFGADGAYASFGHQEDAGYFYRNGFFQIYPETRIHADPVHSTRFPLPPDFFFGCPATTSYLSATEKGYVLGDAYGFGIQLRSFNPAGELLSPNLNPTFVESDALGFSMAATWPGDHAVFWLGYGQDEDQTSATLYATFFDPSHQVTVDSVALLVSPNPCEAGASMQAFALDDSCYQLFFTASDTLWHLKVDLFGNIKRSLEHAPVYHPEQVPADVQPENQIALSNVVNCRFSVFVFHHYSWRDNSRKFFDQTRQYDFNLSGEITEHTILEEAYLDFSNFHKVSEHISQVPQARNDDIYLYTVEQSAVVDSIKLNDDIFGANHTDPIAIPAPDNRFLVSWLEEGTTTKSRLIESNGTFLTGELQLEDVKGVFLPSGEFVTFWRRASNNIHTLGYRIFSQTLDDIVTEQTITQRYDSGNWLRALAAPVDENSFVVLLQDSVELRLLKFSKNDGLLIDKLLMTGANLFPRKLSFDASGTIWALWLSANTSSYLQTFDTQLNKRSSILSAPSAQTDEITFFPGGKFAYLRGVSLPVSEMGYHLVIRDTVSGEPEIDIIIERFFVTQTSLSSADGKSLLFSYQDGSAIWYQSFDLSGSPLVEKSLIYQSAEVASMTSSVALSNQQALFIWSDATEPGNGFDILGRAIPLSAITSVESPTEPPVTAQLLQNYPNPFNPETFIRYRIAKAGFVKLEIYNVLGKLVRTLVASHKNAGEHAIKWDGRNADARLLPSGVYFSKLSIGEVVKTSKMVLAK